jgi:hypothetical protein
MTWLLTMTTVSKEEWKSFIAHWWVWSKIHWWARKQPQAASFSLVFWILWMVACALRVRKLNSIVKGLGSKIWPHKVSFQLTKDLREYYRKEKLLLNRKNGKEFPWLRLLMSLLTKRQQS